MKTLLAGYESFLCMVGPGSTDVLGHFVFDHVVCLTVLSPRSWWCDLVGSEAAMCNSVGFRVIQERRMHIGLLRAVHVRRQTLMRHEAGELRVIDLAPLKRLANITRWTMTCCTDNRTAAASLR